MQLKHYTSLLFVILTISACKQGNEPLNEDLTKLNDKLTFELNGTFNMPEWVDLESDKQEQAKAFTLRHNDKGYPKIRLSGIEDEGLAFEAFPSSVWLYTPSNSYNFRIDVEDHGQADPTISGTNKSYGTGPNNRGVSRIIKRGDKYHVMVKYEVSARQGQPTTYSGESYPSVYAPGTRAFVAFNHHRADTRGASIHRLYMPHVHNVLAKSPIPPLPPLKHIPGDFIVAESSTTRDNSKRFKLPFISKYADLSTLETQTKAVTQTNFYMAGALLALKFENKQTRPIHIRKILVKSNNLAFSGFYELWKRHPDKANNLPSSTHTRPFFARSEGGETSDDRRKAVYEFDIQDEAGNAYHLAPKAKTSGRFYLWGGIDTKANSAGNITELRVQYSVGSTIETTNVINIAPRTGSGQFEEGKAYIITIPIQ